MSIIWRWLSEDTALGFREINQKKRCLLLVMKEEMYERCEKAVSTPDVLIVSCDERESDERKATGRDVLMKRS